MGDTGHYGVVTAITFAISDGTSLATVSITTNSGEAMNFTRGGNNQKKFRD